VPIEPTRRPRLVRPDEVEATLAKALGEAAAAGRFDIVSQLASVLAARRSRRAVEGA
jgi:hypothetical protein